MKKLLLLSLTLLSIGLIGCGKAEPTEPVTTENTTAKENLVVEETVVEEPVQEEPISVPFDCEVIIDDETGTDYLTLFGTMNDIEQLNAYVTTSLTLGDKYPNSVFSYSLESGEQILISFNNGEQSIISSNSDGSGELALPAWYEETNDDSAADIIEYALSKAKKGDWTTVK